MKYFVKEINGKLMLTSRDIQIGDKVICPDPYERGTPEEFEIVSTETGSNVSSMGINPKVNNGKPVWMNAQTFKVIGEISPEATWVNEGDEFEEDHIRVMYTKKYDCICESKDRSVYRTPQQACCSQMIDDQRGGDICLRQIDVIDFVELKGSCGHFH